MQKEMNDVQVGTYLSCLHRQRNTVKEDSFHDSMNAVLFS